MYHFRVLLFHHRKSIYRFSIFRERIIEKRRDINQLFWQLFIFHLFDLYSKNSSVDYISRWGCGWWNEREAKEKKFKDSQGSNGGTRSGLDSNRKSFTSPPVSSLRPRLQGPSFSIASLGGFRPNLTDKRLGDPLKPCLARLLAILSFPFSFPYDVHINHPSLPFPILFLSIRYPPFVSLPCHRRFFIDRFAPLEQKSDGRKK